MIYCFLCDWRGTEDDLIVDPDDRDNVPLCPACGCDILEEIDYDEE
jgi:hypothetical protein